MNQRQSMELVDTARELSDPLDFSVMFPPPVANEKGRPTSLAHAQFGGSGLEDRPSYCSSGTGDQNSSSFDSSWTYSESHGSFSSSTSWDSGSEVRAGSRVLSQPLAEMQVLVA